MSNIIEHRALLERRYVKTYVEFYEGSLGDPDPKILRAEAELRAQDMDSPALAEQIAGIREQSEAA